MATTNDSWLGRLSAEVGLTLDLLEVSVDEAHYANRACFARDTEGQVTALNLSNLGLSRLPAVVSELRSLRILRLLNNQLDSLPLELEALVHLRCLYLAFNHVATLPEAVLRLPSLKVLGLNHNRLTTLPTDLTMLSALRTLGLTFNQLHEVPSGLRLLTGLRSLFLDHNMLELVPEWLSSLSDLRALSLARNPIAILPRTLGQLRELRYLSLRESALTTLGDDLLALGQLEVLDLNGVRITAIPPDIFRLRNLRSLDLNGTDIRGLPAGFAGLQDLVELNLGSLKMATIPAEVLGLERLTSLNLSGTRLQTLPAEIGRLQRLEHLDLSSTGLVSIPAEVFGLRRLKSLNLSGNRLRELPPQIVQCDLPIQWKAGSDERGIRLSGNPLVSPPLEIVHRGTEAVHAYFGALKGRLKPIDEVKILLVGDGGAGKTSLVRRITGTGYDENEPQTHGINISDHVVVTRGKRVKAHFWDFGGQEIMHATHQFFLSKRSAYVIVLDGRKDEKTEYWLKHVQTFGGDSPILVVLNKIDEQSGFDVNRRFLAEKYPAIVGFQRVSCRTGEGIAALCEAVAAMLARVEHTKTLWAATWFAVKQRLESMTEDFISFSEFRALCRAEAVNGFEEQEALVEFLHDLGVVLRFRDIPLRDTNVISPRWVTEGVYRIVNAGELASAGGLLDLGLLGRILPAASHPAEKHGFIIELMKKFELCYAVNDATVLLPGLLPVDEPAFTWEGEGALRFYVDYEFLPKSVMPRLIVKMHADIEQNLRWRTGVVLANAAFGSRAIVRADELERRIVLIVEGDQKREYLGVILYALHTINATFEKLAVREQMPMPDRPDVTVSYAHLLRLERSGVRRYMPDGAEREYDVQELLGMVVPAKRTEDEILELLRGLRSREDTEESLAEKANQSFMLQPNFFGVGVNLNNLIQRVIGKKT